MSEPSAAATETTEPYRVLARKYRPSNFSELIGQDALVRTLSNAIEGKRIAHAFILTGVRGVGKTTTARIIARALNCVGPDGKGGPSVTPCGQCEHCLAIAADRDVDVIEMDAASRTSVGEMREMLDGVRYRPVSARYKVYIVDEVHMLSTHAFNALLKTLEEPPEHVVFIFATTEIGKVPVTVLSRCQRFDLRRVDQGLLEQHFAQVAEREGVAVEAEALSMIARAADGSVRDGLSLLDQAIALGGGEVRADTVRQMLGLADRARSFDLLEAVLKGEIAEALKLFAELYEVGADPAVVIEDLLELVHGMTQSKLVAEAALASGLPEAERKRGQAMAEALSIPALARAWQMLLKGLGEVRQAPLPRQAAEMVLIRLAHASNLPTPGELIRRIEGAEELDADGGPVKSAPPAPSAPVGTAQRRAAPARSAAAAQPAAHPEAEAVSPAADTPLRLESFEQVVELFWTRREAILAGHLTNDVHLVRFEPGLLEIRPSERAPRDLAARIGQRLQDWTGRRWVVSLSSAPGEPSLAERRKADEMRLRQEALSHPLVQAVMESFPGAKLVALRDGSPESDGDEG